MTGRCEWTVSILGSSCIFPVPSPGETAEFYVSKLGFRAVEYLRCREPHICLYRDKAEIILLRANTGVLPNRELYGYGYDAYLYTENQELLEKEFIAGGVKIIRPLSVTDYQNRELVVEDPDGRWLAFGAKTV